MKKPQVFKQDHSKDNVGLHALYVRWAIQHILIIDKAIKSFEDESNLNFLDIIINSRKSRTKLIIENAAYYEAWQILEELANKKLINRFGDLFIGYNAQAET